MGLHTHGGRSVEGGRVCNVPPNAVDTTPPRARIAPMDRMGSKVVNGAMAFAHGRMEVARIAKVGGVCQIAIEGPVWEHKRYSGTRKIGFTAEALMDILVLRRK